MKIHSRSGAHQDRGGVKTSFLNDFLKLKLSIKIQYNVI